MLTGLFPCLEGHEQRFFTANELIVQRVPRSGCGLSLDKATFSDLLTLALDDHGILFAVP